MPAGIPIRRSLLYVPGDKENMLAKAGQRGADALILNLEDAVAPGNKELARLAVSRALGTKAFGHAEVVVRINPLDTDIGYRDLLEVMRGGPDAILLPKVRGVEEVRFAAWTIERLESLHGLPVGSTRIMCMIESVAGILAAEAVAACHPRVTALLFGANDLSTEIGCDPAPDGRALLYAASKLVLAARAANIDAIDSPHMVVGDLEGLARSARAARELGFTGKSAIHPEQIGPINDAFSPGAAEVAWARRVMELIGEGQAGPGAALLDGQLIEAPHLVRARRILAVAEALGL